MTENTPLNSKDGVVTSITKQGNAKLDCEEPNNGVPLPFIGHLSLARQIRFLFVLMLVALVWAGFFVWLSADQKELKVRQFQIVGDALVHTHRISKAVSSALDGHSEAFKELQESQAALSRNLDLLIRGGSYQDYQLGSAQAVDLTVLKESQRIWSTMNTAAEALSKSQKELLDFEQTLSKLVAASHVLVNSLEEIATSSMASPKEAVASSQLLGALFRLRDGKSLVAEHPDAASTLKKELLFFSQLIDGSNALPLKLAPLQPELFHYRRLIEALLNNAPSYATAKQAGQVLLLENEELRTRLGAVQTNYRNQSELIRLSNYSMLLGFVMALIAAASMAWALLKESRYRVTEAATKQKKAAFQSEQLQQQAQKAKQINDHNQAAILTLMNELQEVAGGDLTVQATVAEGITGAIADSINYTLEELRILMRKVISATEQIVAATNEAEEVSDMLLSTAAQQLSEIQKVGEVWDKPATTAAQRTQFADSMQSATDNIQEIMNNAMQTQSGAEQTTHIIHELSRLAQELENAVARFRVTV